MSKKKTAILQSSLAPSLSLLGVWAAKRAEHGSSPFSSLAAAAADLHHSNLGNRDIREGAGSINLGFEKTQLWSSFESWQNDLPTWNWDFPTVKWGERWKWKYETNLINSKLSKLYNLFLQAQATISFLGQPQQHL